MGRKLKRRKKIFKRMRQEFFDKYGVTPEEFLAKWCSRDPQPDTFTNNMISHEALCLEIKPKSTS